MDKDGRLFGNFRSIYSFGETDCLLILDQNQKVEGKTAVYVSHEEGEDVDIIQKFKKAKFGKLDLLCRQKMPELEGSYFSNEYDREHVVSEILKKGSVIKSTEMESNYILKKITSPPAAAGGKLKTS
jgi:hypothetical protein